MQSIISIENKRKKAMPRKCQIQGCEKTAKLRSNDGDPIKYFCLTSNDEHNSSKTGLTFTKIVNCPCQTCVSLAVEDVKEATYGPIVNGKLKRMYCKHHISKNESAQIVPKIAIVRQCVFEGCQLQPSFCLPGETKRKFCKKHKPETAVNTAIALNLTCIYESAEEGRCIISANYGFADDQKPRYCQTHRLAGMKNIVEMNRKSPRGCEVVGCPITRAIFGLPGDKKATRCRNHRTERMIDVVTKKCNGCGLYVVNGTKNNLCSYCSPDTKKQRQKETIIENILQLSFPTRNFVNNQTFAMDTSCSIKKYRPDFSLDCGFYYIIVECDEDAHRQYDNSCETKRMYEIASGLGMPVIFIRYNPDSFTMGNETKHARISSEFKRMQLVRIIDTYLNTVTYESMDEVFKKSTIIVHYLFYDNQEQSYSRIVGLVENNDNLEEIKV